MTSEERILKGFLIMVVLVTSSFGLMISVINMNILRELKEIREVLSSATQEDLTK